MTSSGIPVRGGRLRELASDPPLRQRLLWRDPIRSATLISDDRGLMARTFGTFLLLGGVAGAVLLVFGEHTEERDESVIVVLTAVALALAALCFLVYRRLPGWFFPLAMLSATSMIGLGSAVTSHGAVGVYALFYVWIAVLSSLFFTVRMAALQIMIALAVFAATLFTRDVPFAINALITSIFVLGTSGAIIVMLRGRVEQLAAASASEALTDPVTGIANRRGFNSRFELEIGRTDRSTAPLSLIMCDLDRFKSVNDLLGHDRGDVALQAAAGAIADSVRGVDAVGRLGGEEFGVVLPGADEREALEIADRVREGIRTAFSDHQIALTASCGTATLDRDGDNREALMRSADAALYEAKRRGRDRSVPFSAIVEPAPRDAPEAVDDRQERNGGD